MRRTKVNKETIAFLIRNGKKVWTKGKQARYADYNGNPCKAIVEDTEQ